MSRRAVYLEYTGYRDEPHSAFLVLDQQIGREVPGGAQALGEVGVNHFGLWVSDLDAVIARARQHGFEPAAPPQVLESSVSMGEEPGSFHRGVAYQDPEGNVVQIDERLVSGQ